MDVLAGSTDVTTYFVLRLAADGAEATGLTVTNFDLQYVRSGAAPSAKVDATALAATDSAHGDNQAIEIDATDQPGLYRVDWPDAAFAAGVREVILSVKCATCFTEHLRVNLTPVPANVESWNNTSVPNEHTAGYPIVTIKDGTGTGEINTNGGAVALVDLVTTTTTATNVTTVNGLAANVITAAATHADFGTEIGTAVWATATRELTALDEDATTLDLDVTIRAAVGLASANLDTQLDALPTAAETADAVWDEDATAHQTQGSFGQAIGDPGADTDTIWALVNANLNATVSSRSSHGAADVWAVATRELTAGTNIVLAKGVGVTGFNDLSTTDVATAVWNAATATYGSAGSYGLLLETTLDVNMSTRASQTSVDTIDDFLDTEVAAIKAKTDNLPADPADASDIAASFASIAATLASISAFLDTEIAAILEDTGTTLPAQIAALNNLSAAQVNAEVVDALATDTYAEPAAVPAATASLKDKIGWLAMLARNKITQTAALQAVRNDADSANVGTAAVSDDGTVATRGEFS